MDVERLGAGAQRALENAALERMHRGRRDTLGDSLQLSRSLDASHRIDELEVQRCVHDAAMTGNGTLTLSNPRADARKSLLYSPVRCPTCVYGGACWRLAEPYLTVG